jgi:hypothetical protein
MDIPGQESQDEPPPDVRVGTRHVIGLPSLLDSARGLRAAVIGASTPARFAADCIWTMTQWKTGRTLADSDDSEFGPGTRSLEAF